MIYQWCAKNPDVMVDHASLRAWLENMSPAPEAAMALWPGTLAWTGSVLWQVRAAIDPDELTRASQAIMPGRLVQAPAWLQVYRQLDEKGYFTREVLRQVEDDPIPGMVLHHWIWRDGQWCGPTMDAARIALHTKRQRAAMRDPQGELVMEDQR